MHKSVSWQIVDIVLSLALIAGLAGAYGGLGAVILDQSNDVKCYNEAEVLMQSDALCGSYPPDTFALYGVVGGAILGILPVALLYKARENGCDGACDGVCKCILCACVCCVSTVLGSAVLGCSIEDCADKTALAGVIGTLVGVTAQGVLVALVAVILTVFGVI